MFKSMPLKRVWGAVQRLENATKKAKYRVGYCGISREVLN
jgi:hypothetical protein